MNIHYLLYSRSLTNDYRWLVCPKNISQNDLGLLVSFYRLYSRYKGHRIYQESDRPPLLCINGEGYLFLVIFHQTELKDVHGRAIFCMQGICIPNSGKKLYSGIAHYLLIDYYDRLNVWKSINFQEADSITLQDSRDNLSIDTLVGSSGANISTSDKQWDITKRTYIEFSSSGLQQLFMLLSSPYTPIIEFAFGFPREIQKETRFAVIAIAENPYSYTETEPPIIFEEDEYLYTETEPPIIFKEDEDEPPSPPVNPQIRTCQIDLFEYKPRAIPEIIQSFLPGPSKLVFYAWESDKPSENYVDKSKPFEKPFNSELMYTDSPPDNSVQAFDELVQKLENDGWRKTSQYEDRTQWWAIHFTKEVLPLKGNNQHYGQY